MRDNCTVNPIAITRTCEPIPVDVDALLVKVLLQPRCPKYSSFAIRTPSS